MYVSSKTYVSSLIDHRNASSKTLMNREFNTKRNNATDIGDSTEPHVNAVLIEFESSIITVHYYTTGIEASSDSQYGKIISLLKNITFNKRRARIL